MTSKKKSANDQSEIIKTNNEEYIMRESTGEVEMQQEAEVQSVPNLPDDRYDKAAAVNLLRPIWHRNNARGHSPRLESEDPQERADAKCLEDIKRGIIRGKSSRDDSQEEMSLGECFLANNETALNDLVSAINKINETMILLGRRVPAILTDEESEEICDAIMEKYNTDSFSMDSWHLLLNLIYASLFMIEHPFAVNCGM